MFVASFLFISITFPGVAPCDGSLQSCISSVPDGTRIEIATNGPILATGFLRIGHSLTLTAASGYHPVIGGTGAIILLSADTSPSLDLTVSNLTVDQSKVSIVLSKGTNHHVTVRDCTISTTASEALSVLAEEVSTVTLQGNRLNKRGMAVNLATDASIFVLGNTIVPETGNTPLLFQMTSMGSATATIANNVLSSEGTSDYAVHLAKPSGGSNPYAFYVFNNTLAHATHAVGLTVNGMGVVSVEVDNNAISDVSVGIQRNGSSDNVSINATHNNMFSTTTDSAATGASGTMTVTATTHGDPLYVSATDFHLQALSPLIGGGTNTPPTGALPSTDADGNARIIGATVDIGAYEFGPPPPAPSGELPSTPSGPVAGTDPVLEETPLETEETERIRSGCHCHSADPPFLLALATLLLRTKRKSSRS